MGFMTIREAANFLNVTIETMRTWDKTGKLPSYRTEGGHRRYDKDELIKYLNTNHPVLKDKITIAYARVSTSSQKDDLERQEKVLTNYCEIHGYKFKVISDIGSGLNYNKKGLKEVIELISNNRADRLVLNYKDRLIRFGFELIEQLCQIHNVEIEIINQTKEITDNEELVEDVLSVITVYSAKLYGSRSHKNKEVIEKNKQLFEAN